MHNQSFLVCLAGGQQAFRHLYTVIILFELDTAFIVLTAGRTFKRRMKSLVPHLPRLFLLTGTRTVRTQKIRKGPGEGSSSPDISKRGLSDPVFLIRHFQAGVPDPILPKRCIDIF